jgi:hypothetical protein
MSTRLERLSVYAGVVAVILWIVGIAIAAGMPSSLASHPTDQQVLAWVQDNSGALITGGWLFMVGSLFFVWFLGILRGRLAAAEGAPATFSTIGFTAGVVGAVLVMGTPAGDLAVAINKDDISPAAAAALHSSGDLFFVLAELTAIVLLLGLATVAIRTATLPKWWAIVNVVLAVVLVIGPIGWAALIFGMPLWTLVTTGLLVRGGAAAPAAVATAGA